MEMRHAPGETRKVRSATTSWLLICLCSCLLFALLNAPSNIHAAQARRVVVLKVDGLPDDTVERFARERDPQTGKSLLPWIDYVFRQRGTRLANFYVRGMSLSAPSWSLLDTGQHLQIKGNVEFDRYTLHSYDYLNFIPYWVANIGGVHVDMPGVELLDEIGVPLLADAYPNDERHLSFQLYQRGTRWTTLQEGLQKRFTTRAPKELFDEWVTGFEARTIVNEQLERELIEKLNDPKIRYLDFYSSDFDHAAHHNRDRATHLAAAQELDALVGRFWVAIQKSPLAAQTVFVLVSDHGTNSDERFYSQGYNLVKLLASAAGGGHHVVTKRRLLSDYALKGIYPLVSLVYTTTPDTFYLKGLSNEYPTALVDFDGNERAAIHLRDSDLNVLHILLQQLQRRDLAAPMRRAATDAFFNTLDRRRLGWQSTLDALREELGALQHLIEKQTALVEAKPKKWTPEDKAAGRDRDSQRDFARLNSMKADERQYTEYARTLSNLLALRRETFAPAAIRVEEIIARGAMGDQNNIYQLQNYVVGTASGGLALSPDGSLDLQNSFTRVDYFSLIGGVSVRNNVQPGVENHPVDFIATRLPDTNLGSSFDVDPKVENVVWLDGGLDNQALILSRTTTDGQLLLRYVPIANLREDAAGRITFERVKWRASLPLKIFEDAQLALTTNTTRADWLDGWHTDLEWLRATHLTKYSNAVVGLQEQFAVHDIESLNPDAPGITADESLMRRFRRRQRQLVTTDLLILANDHWNFDVRGFNPGGNHGSFFRISTHSTLMFSGGAATKIPQGLVIEEPYDSLSFMPTILALTGEMQDGGALIPALRQRGFRPFPGRVINDIFNPQMKNTAPENQSPLAPEVKH